MEEKSDYPHKALYTISLSSGLILAIDPDVLWVPCVL